MAVTSNVVSSNLRVVDDEGAIINSFRHISADVFPEQLAGFVMGIGMIRGETPAATFLTITSELESN